MACNRLSFIRLKIHNRHLILFLLLAWNLLLNSPTSTHKQFMAQGRNLPKLSVSTTRINEEKELIMRSLIGSRPPKCDDKCKSCGHCEAVQVPIIVPAKKIFRIDGSRGDEILDYKPMCWKCKCGDIVFNPW